MYLEKIDEILLQNELFECGDSNMHSPIFAKFYKCKLALGGLFDVGEFKMIDVSSVVLTREKSVLHRLIDNHSSTDALVPYALHWHDGLYRVEVCENICSHFSVKNLWEISQSMIDLSKIKMFSEKNSVTKNKQNISLRIKK